jgi:hypothetical protein
VSLTPVANLSPVLLIPLASCHRCQKFATDVTDTGGKFATGTPDVLFNTKSSSNTRLKRNRIIEDINFGGSNKNRFCTFFLWRRWVFNFDGTLMPFKKARLTTVVQ